MGQDFTDMLISGSPTFLEAYDEYCPFKRYGQLEYHAETIRLRRELGSPAAALNDQMFLRSLHRTLQAWGLGARASILKPFPDFVSSLQAKASEIAELGNVLIDDPALNVPWVAEHLGRLVKTLDTLDNKATVVAGSKALHHLLPDLVVPIDRKYPQRFFGWDNGRLQYMPEECVAEALRCFVQVAQATNPVQYVKGGWYTSRTKIIDNAIVGWWCWVQHNVKLPGSRLERGLNEVEP